MSYHLDDMVNKELLLKHAIEVLNDNIDSEIGQQILTWYILNELPEDHTEDEFYDKYNLYLARGTLESLCAKGLLEFNFETKKYDVTLLGKKVQKELRKK